MITDIQSNSIAQAYDLDFEDDLKGFFQNIAIPKGERFSAKRCPDAMFSLTLGELQKKSIKKCKTIILKCKGGEVAEVQAIRKVEIDNQKQVSCIKDIKKIILILESPHTSEFENENMIAPAQGPTGRNIKSYLPSVFCVK